MDNQKEIDVLYIDTDVLKAYNDKVYENVKSLGLSKNNTSEDFAGLKNKNIYRKGLTNIERGIGETRDTLYNSYIINGNYIEEFIRLEEKGKSLVREIKIPNIFSTNSSSIGADFASINVSKNDGTSVTNGQLVDGINDDIYNEEKEEIKNIKTDENGEEHTIDDSLIEKEFVENIEKELEDSVEDSNYVIKEETIGNISVGEDNDQLKNEQKTNVLSQTIGNINSGEETSQLKDNKEITIETQVIGNINNEQEDNENDDIKPIMNDFDQQPIEPEPIQIDVEMEDPIDENVEVNVDDNKSEI